MSNIEREIRKHPFLSGLPENHLSGICSSANEVHFEAGEIILREREPAFHAYLILEGTIHIEAHSRVHRREAVIDKLGAGDLLGWS